MGNERKYFSRRPKRIVPAEVLMTVLPVLTERDIY